MLAVKTPESGGRDGERGGGALFRQVKWERPRSE